MVSSIRVVGKVIRNMEMVNLFTQMAILFKPFGKRIRKTVTPPSPQKTERSSRLNITMTS